MHNTFDSTLLKDISNNKATILHTDFNESEFDSVKLADYTALFSIFEACIFKSFTINVDALGLSFGLDREDLAKIKLLFLGEEQVWPDAIGAGEVVIQSLEARLWPLHLAVARSCYSDLPGADACKSVFCSATIRMMVRGRSVEMIVAARQLSKRIF